MKPKFEIHDLVGVADFKKNVLKKDRIKWSLELYELIEIIIDTILSYCIDSLPERYNETLLNKTELSMKENKNVMKVLNLG